MSRSLPERVDFLVIGSGISGLFFALKAAVHGRVLVVTKSFASDSATCYAQGGIAAAVSKVDNAEKHFNDTLKAGAGLCESEAVKILVEEGITRVEELIQMGVDFTRAENGELHLGREGGHSLHRVVHAHDHTGREIEQSLFRKVRNHENIELFDFHMVIDLITEHQLRVKNRGRCYGAYILNEKTAVIERVIASYTVLATGGAGRVYPHTTNPSISTGDGIAMAYRAGCRIRNMEFYQFHPTALYSDADPAFLMTEALRGHGARLTLRDGSTFMHRHHPQKELAPRDIVARAIDSELKKSGDDYVYLDITHVPPAEIEEHFPYIHTSLKERFSIDMTREPVPVIPAAHYMCGGILTDVFGRTDVDFLYAIGEAASTGVHGANRLASNSLLEGIVFAHRAAGQIADRNRHDEHTIKKKAEQNIPAWSSDRTRNLEEWVLIRHDLREIKTLMWDYVGIERSKLRLERALPRIDLIYREVIEFYNRTIPNRELLELRNLSLVAQLIVRSAMSRKESRGLHFMTDYPENREPSREDTVLTPRLYHRPG